MNENIIELFKKLGYREDIIEKILNSNFLSNFRVETLIKNVERNYNFLISLGYSKDEVIKMTRSLPAIYCYNIENLQEKVEGMQKLGYTREEVIKMTKCSPSIFGYSIESIQEKIEGMKNFGYTGDDVIRITKNLPSIFGYSIEYLQEKIEVMQKLGYSRQEVIKMTKNSPTLYSYSIENMKEKIEVMQQLGYERDEVLEMTKTFPAMFGFSTENLQQKIEFYNSIGLHSAVLNIPTNLMQSIAVTYARYMYFKENAIQIDETNKHKLFLPQKRFEMQYGVKKESLLAKYNYKEYTFQKNTQSLGKETILEQNDTQYINETVQEMDYQEKNINVIYHDNK